MLQSALYAGHQQITLASPLAFVRHLGMTAKRAGSFARFGAWSRELVTGNDVGGLNGHLLRDIGLDRSVTD